MYRSNHVHDAPTIQWKRNLGLGLAVGVAVLPTIAVAVDVPWVFQAGDPVVAEQLNDDFAALGGAIDGLAIREDTAIAITPDQPCAAIQEELDALDARQIVGGAVVTIELAPGTYTCDAPIVVRHPAGDRIQIRGTGNTPAEVVLTFPADTSGVVVHSARALGGLGNLTLQGASGPTGGVGVDASAAAAVWASDLVVQGFVHGIHVAGSSTFSGTNVALLDNVGWGAVAAASASIGLGGCEASNNFGGLLAQRGASIGATDCITNDNASHGYHATMGGVLEIHGSTAAGNVHGYVAGEGGMLYVDGSSATGNEIHGMLSGFRGSILAVDTSSSSNGGYGYTAVSGSYLYLGGTYDALGNGAGATNIPYNAPTVADGSVITLY